MMTEWLVHPALFLLAGAALMPWLRGRGRDLAVVMLPLLALICVWLLPEGQGLRWQWLGQELVWLQVDALSRLFATAFCIIALLGGVFALRQPARLELPAAFLYAAAALGAVFAADLLALFICWELMLLGSTLVLWSAGTPAAWAASRRYVAIHLLGGVLLFAGIAALVAQTGSAAMTTLTLDSAASWLIVAGFLVNAGALPVSVWVSDAYPRASSSGMVFLSAFTTKVAVYVLWRTFPGTSLLLWMGVAMALYGALFALREDDIRRTLAYGIVNQVGMILAAIGLGGELALNGAAAQAVAGIAYTGLMLMVTGAVIDATGKRRCSELGGLARQMPVAAICCGIAAATMAGAPLSFGFLGKGMIVQAAAEAHHQWAWLLLKLASVGVVLYGGLKLPWFIFLRPRTGLQAADVRGGQRSVMLLLALVCVLPGLWPAGVFSLLPFSVADYHAYSAGHVISQLQLMLFAALGYALALRWLQPLPGRLLDVDWLWRRAAWWQWQGVMRLLGEMQRILDGSLGMSAQRARQLLRAQARPGGMFWRTWPTGSMSFWTVVMLLAYLGVYYLR